MRYVLYSGEAGIYLGSAMGFGFWSKWDPVGQDQAPTFETVEQAEEYRRSWETPGPDFECVPIDTEQAYVTIFQCVEAGLPAWDPD